MRRRPEALARASGLYLPAPAQKNSGAREWETRTPLELCWVSTTEAPRVQRRHGSSARQLSTLTNSVFSMPLWILISGFRSRTSGAARLSDPCDGESSPSCVACGYQFYVVLYQSSSLPQSSVSFLKFLGHRGQNKSEAFQHSHPCENYQVPVCQVFQNRRYWQTLHRVMQRL